MLFKNFPNCQFSDPTLNFLDFVPLDANTLLDDRILIKFHLEIRCPIVQSQMPTEVSESSKNILLGMSIE